MANSTNHISLQEQIGAVSGSIETLKSTVGIFEEDRERQSSVLLELNKMMAVRESLKQMADGCRSAQALLPVKIVRRQKKATKSFDLDRVARINDTMAALGILLYGSHVAIAESSLSLTADNMRRIAKATIRDAQDLLNSLEAGSLVPETECVGYAGTI